VVLDTYCIPASMLPHRKGTEIVQMWHALGAVKKFGWQTVGKDDGTSERTAKLMKMHRGYDHVICASDITAGHFCEAFGATRDKIAKYGLPRIDYIRGIALGSEKQKTADRIYGRYPETRGQKVILYAPTFRRDRAVDVRSLADRLDPDKYAVAVKLHPLYRAGAADSEPGYGKVNVIYDDSFSSYDWLSVADIIISDYSSLVIEATLADKPLFIYAYDLDEYEASTGLNMDFCSEPIAPYVFRDASGLAECMDKDEYDFDALHAFRDRYIDIDTSDCTSALADFIELLVPER
jgi:CDP-ribitol ribitolphosphotransferase